MPNPTPTQEEMHWAKQYADAWCNAKDSRYRNLARGFHYLTAELARAEERLRLVERLDQPWALRAFVAVLAEAAGVLLYEKNYDARGWEDITHARNAAEEWLEATKALDQDDKLARGESEEQPDMNDPIVNLVMTQRKAAAPKFTPKPGDSVVLVSSPDENDQRFVGRDGEVTTVNSAGRVSLRMPNKQALPLDWCFVLDAVFALAPTQAEQPPAVVGEVTDEELVREALQCGQCDNSSPPCVYCPTTAREALMRLASAAAEVAELKREVEQRRADQAQLSKLLDERSAELEAEKAKAWADGTLRQDLEAAVTRIEELATRATTAEGEAEQASRDLEAEKAAHQRMREERDHHREKALFGEALEARAVPSALELAPFIREGYFGAELRERGPWSSTTVEERADWINAAKRAIYLFTGKVEASPPASPDNTPPEPSTDRARLEAEGWCFEAPPESEVGQMHALIREEHQHVAAIQYVGIDVEEGEESVPSWNGEYYMGECGSVLAWRRAKPVAPSPDAGIEAVKAEVAELTNRLMAFDGLEEVIAELELQGWVTRRLAASIWDQRCQEDFRRTEDSGEAIARIEREERERAGKPNPETPAPEAKR